MSFWNIFGNMAVSDKGETITRLSDTMSVSSSGVSYNKMGDVTIGSDGSSFIQMGDFSTDGSTRMGCTTTGLGAVFNDEHDAIGRSCAQTAASNGSGLDDDCSW